MHIPHINFHIDIWIIKFFTDDDKLMFSSNVTLKAISFDILHTISSKFNMYLNQEYMRIWQAIIWQSYPLPLSTCALNWLWMRRLAGVWEAGGGGFSSPSLFLNWVGQWSVTWGHVLAAERIIICSIWDLNKGVWLFRFKALGFVLLLLKSRVLYIIGISLMRAFSILIDPISHKNAFFMYLKPFFIPYRKWHYKVIILLISYKI